MQVQPPEEIVPTSTMLFHALAASRPGYLDIRLKDYQTGIDAMRDAHARYANSDEVINALKAQRRQSTSEEIVSMRGKNMKRQAENISLQETEEKRLKTELEQLEVQPDPWLSIPPAVSRQLPALRVALKAHFAPIHHANNSDSETSFDKLVSNYKQLLLLQKLACKSFVRTLPWAADPHIGQKGIAAREKKKQELGQIVEQLSDRGLSPTELCNTIEILARSLFDLECLSIPDQSLGQQLRTMRRNLMINTLQPFWRLIQTQPAARITERQLITKVRRVTSMVAVVELSGTRVNRLKMTKDMFIVGRELEAAYARLRADSPIEPNSLLFVELPENVVDYVQRWQIKDLGNVSQG